MIIKEAMIKKTTTKINIMIQGETIMINIRSKNSINSKMKDTNLKDKIRMKDTINIITKMIIIKVRRTITKDKISADMMKNNINLSKNNIMENNNKEAMMVINYYAEDVKYYNGRIDLK
jgi:hypothetical protein